MFDSFKEVFGMITPAGFIILAGMTFLHWKTAREGLFWMVIYRLPSTLAHELFGHYLIALLTGAQPVNVSIWPRCEGKKCWTLGSVTCTRINFFSAVPVGLAPLINIVPAWYALCFAVETGSMVAYALVHVFLMATLPSSVDLKVAFLNPASLVFWGIVGTVGYSFWANWAG